MAIGDIFKASFEHTLGLGQDAVWTAHYKLLDTTLTLNEAEDLANELWGKLDGDYQQIMVGSTVLDRVTVVQVTGNPLQFSTLTLAEVGTMTGQQLPPQTAPLVSWYTAQIGRNQHGRAYLTPISESFQNAGQIDNSIQTFIQDTFEGLIQLPDGLTPVWQLVVFHRDTNTSTNVTSAVVREDLKTQRRRVVGVGS